MGFDRRKIHDFIEGVCFICLKTEDMPPEAYCHYCCARAFDSEVEKRIKELKDDTQGT